MTTDQQKSFILNLYEDLFRKADVTKINNYCSSDFTKENNYEISDYQSFVKHIEDLATEMETVSFDIEFIVNVPDQVVIRTIVQLDGQIKGAPPLSLLITYWGFNQEGKVNWCKEVEYADS